MFKSASRILPDKLEAIVQKFDRLQAQAVQIKRRHDEVVYQLNAIRPKSYFARHGHAHRVSATFPHINSPPNES